MTFQHAAALALVGAMRLLPRSLRWKALLASSAVSAPLVRKGGVEPGLGIDGFREIALWRLMVAAGEVGLAFDPVVRHRGPHPLDVPSRPRGGMLVVGPHSLLNYLLVRLLHDRGRDPVVVTSTFTIPVLGTRSFPRFLGVAPTLLPEALRHLRQGEVICAMIDLSGPEKGTFTVDTRTGPIHIAEPLLGLALRAGSRIAVSTVRIDRGEVWASWAVVPEPATAESVRTLVSDFLVERIEEGHGRGGPRDLALIGAGVRPRRPAL